MTKALLVLAVAIATIAIGCKDKRQRELEAKPKEATNWVVEVRFIDNTIDTITVRSLRQPILRAGEGIGYVDLGDSYMPSACYVKTMRILN